MDGLSTKSKLHSRVSTFAKWVAPDPETRDEITGQVQEIRDRISSKAKEDGLTITATPRAGSFAKNTGLRRHMLGKSEVEGQDIDVPFVVKAPKEGEYRLGPMTDKFFKYTDDSYPKTEKEKTESSVRLKFTSMLSYDLVPLFATNDPEKQILVRSTGEQIVTSEQKHTEFITNRTAKSDKKKGVVLFNECVRLVKWWRDVRCAEGSYLEEVPSIIVDLLCAKAFDKFSVQTTYAQTLAEWFAYLAHVVTKKERVAFSDYAKIPAPDNTTVWQVLDPVNPQNNVARKLQSYEIDELAEWFCNGRDAWNRAIAADLNGDDSRSLEHLVTLFGNSFKNHCED
jgi:tRNA nucleotidyltransferase (CCA-adding enzyme)